MAGNERVFPWHIGGEREEKYHTCVRVMHLTQLNIAVEVIARVIIVVGLQEEGGGSLVQMLNHSNRTSCELMAYGEATVDINFWKMGVG